MAENNRDFLPGDSNLSFFTITPTLTTETPINRAFQANCEGVRVEKEKSFFIRKSDDYERGTIQRIAESLL